MSDRIIVLGGGPTGLGAAWRLRELGHEPWALYEAAHHLGGLACSVVDDQGFTWDLGGHVLFSHYRYFDGLMTAALGDRWIEHEREAWVWIRNRWVPYPLQNNIWRLPEAELLACLDGLLEVERADPAPPPSSFEDWLRAGFGAGLCEVFMLPYNRKVWAYPASELDVGWTGERVARVDLRRVLANVVRRQDDIGWGPNATFRFPERGGTGAIWASLGAQLPPEKVVLGQRVTGVNLGARSVRFADGRIERYDHLVTTIPLDRLLAMIEDAPDLSAEAARFVHSSTHVIGIGMEGSPPPELRTKCWLYFSEPEYPFYRVTVFSNYSPHNVPSPGGYWSLMAEISESPAKPVSADRVVAETVEALERCGMIGDRTTIRSRWHRRLEHGYPTPWLGRDGVLGPIHEQLERAQVYSRGRFGAWKYEVSNQDHSVMQGMEIVGRLLQGTEEHTFHGRMVDWSPGPAVNPSHPTG